MVSTVTGITNVAVSGGALKMTTTGSNAFPAISGTFLLSGGALNVNGGLYSGTIGTGVNQLDISGGGAISNGTFDLNVGGSNRVANWFGREPREARPGLPPSGARSQSVRTRIPPLPRFKIRWIWIPAEFA